VFDILSLIPGKKKTTSAGWHSFNGVCCSHLGHKPDRRSRGGIKFDGQTNWSYHCFNCGYTCAFHLGRSITQKTKNLLIWCGVDQEQVQRWSLESLSHKDLLDFTQRKRHKSKIQFEEHILPDGEVLSTSNPVHHRYINYLASRNMYISDYPFMVTPNAPGRYKDRIIIPYTYRDKIVGHTSRFLDNETPKYINEQQPGYVFGYDFQKPNWQVCILVEGIFDALSINGCALTHNTINDDQALLLAQLNRKIIVVPDRDKTGLDICDRALELGYHVSLPNWEHDIKDVNDAVVRYGKLPTLMSIVQVATMSKIKLSMQRTKIEKQIRT
jgi:hypothetical protein